MRRRAIVYLALGCLLGAMLNATPSTAGAGAAQTGLLRVSVINPDRARLHVQIDPRIPPDAVMIYHGSNVVIYNSTSIIATPGPIPTNTPTSGTITPTPESTQTPGAIWRATVRKFPRLLVMSLAGGSGAQVGAVGYGSVLEIVDERNWWGRIDQPVAGWVDLTWCEVGR